MRAQQKTFLVTASLRSGNYPKCNGTIALLTFSVKIMMPSSDERPSNINIVGLAL